MENAFHGWLLYIGHGIKKKKEKKKIRKSSHLEKKKKQLKKRLYIIDDDNNKKKELNKLLIDIKVEIHGIAYDLIHLDNLKRATRRSAVSSQESRVFFSLFFLPFSPPLRFSQTFFHFFPPILPPGMLTNQALEF